MKRAKKNNKGERENTHARAREIDASKQMPFFSFFLNLNPLDLIRPLSLSLSLSENTPFSSHLRSTPTTPKGKKS